MIPEGHSYAIGELHGVKAVTSSNLVAPTNTFSNTRKTSVPPFGTHFSNEHTRGRSRTADAQFIDDL